MTDRVTGTRHPRLALSAREAAEALGVSERLVRQLTAEGRLPHVRLGASENSRVIYPVAAIEAWLLEQSGIEPTDSVKKEAGE